MKILIIDDSRTARLLLKNAIPALYEPEFEEAADGKEGVDKFRSFKPDITFMDLTMPVMDGFQALEILHKEFPASRIVVLSADIQKQSVNKAKQTGAWRFIKKPPAREDIQKVLEDSRKTPGNDE